MHMLWLFILQEDDNCGIVLWVDPEWPPTLQNALLKLWEMYHDSKSDRRKDNLESSLTIHHLKEEKKNLDANYDRLVEDVQTSQCPGGHGAAFHLCAG